MIDPPAPTDDLEQLFLHYMLELDRSGEIDLDAYLGALNLPSETKQSLRELIETARNVKEMAGPRLEDEELPTQSRQKLTSEETVLVGDQTAEFNTVDSAAMGTILGEYELLEELGRGGMGVVYKAHQIEMGRHVALKMLRSGCLASEEDIQRFYLEARAAGKLKHPSIVRVHQVGEIDGHHYFTMEYIEGDTLSQFVEREGCSAEKIAELMVHVAQGVEFAHQRGLLHRDLKPSNVMIDAHGTPRITDFGLAKDMTSGDHLTTSGSALGTPSYMPPEQARAQRNEISCRSDVYSLGAILYALLTGRPPFRADSMVETLTQVIYEDPVPPREVNPNCPRGLEAICLKCLQKSPADRYATAQDFAEDLQRFLQGDRILARHSYVHDRAWHWLRNVPMIAAVLGRKSTSATPRHVRFQWGFIILAVSLVIGIIWMPAMIESSRLSEIDLATGQPTLSYDRIGQVLKESMQSQMNRQVTVQQSAGAVESHDRLLSGEVDIAFLQANALESDRLKVLAPLYAEVVLIILRNEVPAQNIRELKGLSIALGQPGSGMRLSSSHLLELYGLSESDLKNVNRSFADLDRDTALDGAIVTIKIDDSELHRILMSGKFRLLKVPIPDHTIEFHSLSITHDQLPDGVITGEITVPGTFAILAVREATPDRYVIDFLKALYAEDGVMEQFPDLVPAHRAAGTALNFHAAAHRFFNEARDKTEQTAPP